MSAIIGNFYDNSSVDVSYRIEDFKLDAKRSFLVGTIVNELITNSMKYAFSGKKSGRLNLSLIKKKDDITLTVSDDGPGLPAGFDLNKASGFGLMLIRMLTEQLKGIFTIESRNGTVGVVEFSI